MSDQKKIFIDTNLVVMSAARAQCAELWTEDLNDGQVIRGVRIRNPLS